MIRTLLLAAVLAATLHAQEFRVPFRGIEETGAPNRYVHNGRAIDEDRIFLGTRTTLTVETAAGAVARFTADQSPFLMHAYAGSDRSLWRTNIRSHSALSLGQLAPGITGELADTGEGLAVRLRVAPGADLSSVRFRLDSGGIPITSQVFQAGIDAGLRWRAGEEQGVISSPSATTEALDARGPFIFMVLEDVARFRLRPTQFPDAYTVTMGLPWSPQSSGMAMWVRGTDATGQTWVTNQDTVARFDATGALASLTVVANAALSYLRLTAGGPRLSGSGAAGSPVLATAAQPAPVRSNGGLLVALDLDGRLIDATYADGFIVLAGADTAGSIYYRGVSNDRITVSPGARWPTSAIPDINASYYIGKWTPGRNRFDFQSYSPAREYSFTPAAAGGAAVSWAPPSSPVNTLNVEWLDSEGRATPNGARVVPISNAEGIVSREAGPLASDAAGNLWLTGTLRYAGVGAGNILMKISRAADGRVLWAGASPGATYRLEVDPLNGHLHQFINTRQNSLGSQRNSAFRGACKDGGEYYRKLNADGGFLDGTYLASEYLGFPYLPYTALLTTRGTLEWYTHLHNRSTQDWPRRATPDAASGPPAVTCLVDHASRRPQATAARGQLVTIIGQRLGPLDARATVLASELAGTRVLLDGAPVGLASVQAGLVTFRVPPDFPRPSAQLVVERDGQISTPVTVRITDFAAFGAFTEDGQGWGPAAFFGAAEPGGFVSLFATGLDQAREAYLLIDERHVVKATYIGPTQHLLPGIQQINFRLPADVRRGGRVTVSISPQPPGDWPEARITLPVN